MVMTVFPFYFCLWRVRRWIIFTFQYILYHIMYIWRNDKWSLPSHPWFLRFIPLKRVGHLFLSVALSSLSSFFPPISSLCSHLASTWWTCTHGSTFCKYTTEFNPKDALSNEGWSVLICEMKWENRGRVTCGQKRSDTIGIFVVYKNYPRFKNIPLLWWKWPSIVHSLFLLLFFFLLNFKNYKRKKEKKKKKE